MQLKIIPLVFLLGIFHLSIGQTSIDIITQEKINGTITLLSYSPDGQLIASGSEQEHTIKIWDVKSGKIIGKLEGHENSTSAIAFNSSGTQLISAAEDKKVILWDLVNWKLLDSTSLASPVLTFINDQRDDSFYSGNEGGIVHHWLTDAIKTPTIVYQHEAKINASDIYDDYLVTGDNSGKIIVYNLAEKKKLAEEKIHLTAVKGLNFFNKGTGLITAGTNGKVHLWDINDLSDSKHINTGIALSAYDANIAQNCFVTVSINNHIKLWNLAGEMLQEFKTSGSNSDEKFPVKAIKISPNGTTMASSGAINTPSRKKMENQNVIRIWDLKRGIIYRTLKGTVNPIYTFDFHPTENKLVTLGDNHTLTFWDFDLAEKYGELKLETPHRELAPLRQPGGNKGIDLEKGKRFKDMIERASRGDFGTIKTDTKDKGKDLGVGLTKRLFKERSIVQFSENGSYLITKLKKDEIRLYNMKNGKPSYEKPLFSYQISINQLLSSPDEKHLAVLGAGDSAISIINLETGEFERKLPTAAPKENFRFIYEANSLAFSPDGKLLAVCFNTGKTFVFNTSNWSLVFENILPDNLGYVASPFVNFTRDGKYMVVKSILGLKKYSTDNFNLFASEPLQVDGYSAPMDQPQDYAITIKDNYLYFEDLMSGTVQKSIRVKPNQITHISINPEGLVGITFKSGQFQLIDPAVGEERVLLVAAGDNYIFNTKENYYKVSKEGRDLVTFRIGNQAFPFEQFDAIFNRPDLVLKTMGCPDEALINLYEKAYLKRIKKLGLNPSTSISLTDIPTTEIQNQASVPAITENSTLDLALNFKDEQALSSYNIWINNVPIHGKKGKEISGKSIQINEKIALVHGLNKIQVSCRNANGYESLIQTFYVEKSGEQPDQNLYLITIGTSDYKDERYNLSYPVKDGKDLITLMAGNPTGRYKNVFTKSLFNTEVTNGNIEGLKQFLEPALANDIVIVFVAGHGVLNAEFDYYFGTHNIDFTAPEKNGLAYEKLERLLDGIKANKKLLIMDTCHSGEVDKDAIYTEDETPEEEEEDIAFRSVGTAVKENENMATPSRLANELFNDLRKGTGATVISSAGGAEFAMESDEWKNGLFTYCLLNGLKNRTADLNNDGEIMLLELQTYVVDKVSALSHGRQRPNSRIQNIELDFPIW